MRAAVQALTYSLARMNARPGFPEQQPWDAGQIIVAGYRKFGPQRGLDGSSTVIVRWHPARGTWRAASKLGGAPLR
jgi:hypothetical protein